MCPPAASSWLRSRTGPFVWWVSARAAIAEDGAELAPFVAAGGWHEIRPHIPSATTIRTITLRTVKTLVINTQTTAQSAGRSCKVLACKVLGIVLLNRVCGQVFWIRWTISSAGAAIAPTCFREDTGASVGATSA